MGLSLLSSTQREPSSHEMFGCWAQRILFLNCFLEFLCVFLGFCFFLNRFSQLSYTSQLFKPEQQGHSKQRGERLPFLPASCLVDVF